MELTGKVAIVTGGGNGIGKALCERFAAEGAAGIVVADLDKEAADAVAAGIGGTALRCDVTVESDIEAAVSIAEFEYGPVDVFVSNAGLALGNGGPLACSASNEAWQLNWDIHVMSHVYAARAVLPGMIERGGGYLVNTASAAGLLNQVGDAAYSATKHAAVSFAESLAITHHHQGIKVSVLCPQYVATAILNTDIEAAKKIPGVLTVEEVAECVVQGMAAEAFMLYPHPQVEHYALNRVKDKESWLGGMRYLHENSLDEQGQLDMQKLANLIGGGR